MDIEFHYWITGILAKAAGFPETAAVTLAHASQLVDDNTYEVTIQEGGGAKYTNLITQTADPFMPQRKRLGIYPAFHFVPGDPARAEPRRDGKTHLLNTVPDNQNARDLLGEALQDTSDMGLYRLGIAAHAFVDTWAHQNFVGWEDSFNGQDGNPMPDIGHADFMHHPDRVSHHWNDERLVQGQVDNNLRFINAAGRLFQELTTSPHATPPADPSAEWVGLRNRLLNVFGRTTGGGVSGAVNVINRGREAEYRKLDPWQHGPDYNAHAWLDDSTDYTWPDPSTDFGQKPATLTWKSGKSKQDTPWGLFQEAARAHQKSALGKLAPIFARMGVDVGTL